MRRQYLVRISDMKMASGDADITTYALGSCVGISFYDPYRKMGALLHVLLPEQPVGRDPNDMKYADSGIRKTWSILEQNGFTRENTIVKIAGGARMFPVNRKDGVLGDIGRKNVEMVRKVLAEKKLPIRGEDVGGDAARTMTLDVGTGKVTIRPAGGTEISL
ncbi:MAG: chemotaxis protein CheD [Lachnospiraceae bacterium]|nr:chemotaxis protein CheD [Lachnospiraceae bacterium]